MHPATDLASGDRSAPLRLRRLGRRSFADGLALQEQAARAVEAGADDQLLLLEHPPVVTLGRGASPDQLRVSRRALARAGVAVVETDRGGGATYHGPGQLVGYPIIDLRRRRLGVRSYLRALEAALIRTLQRVDVVARVRPPLTGVWTEAGKLAALGIAVRRGVTRHGFALNVATDLTAFDAIMPCGLDQPVTSLRGLGCAVDVAAIGRSVAADLEEVLAVPSRPAAAVGSALSTATAAGAALGAPAARVALVAPAGPIGAALAPDRGGVRA